MQMQVAFLEDSMDFNSSQLKFSESISHCSAFQNHVRLQSDIGRQCDLDFGLSQTCFWILRSCLESCQATVLAGG